MKFASNRNGIPSTNLISNLSYLDHILHLNYFLYHRFEVSGQGDCFDVLALSCLTWIAILIQILTANICFLHEGPGIEVCAVPLKDKAIGLSASIGGFVGH